LAVGRLLEETIVALAAAIFSLVPLFINPYNPLGSRIVPPKFDLLLGLSALLLIAMLAARLSGIRFTRVPILVPASTFLLVSVLSTAFSENGYLSLVGTEIRRNGLLSLSAGVLVFYAAARFVNSWEKVCFFLRTGVTSSVVIAVYGIGQRFGFDPLSYLAAQWPEPENRVFSTLGNTIFLAAYLTLMMGAATALYFQASSRWERTLWLSALAAIGACWLYTYTRGAVLGVGVALPIVVWLAYRRIGTIRPMLAPLASLAVSVLIAAVLTIVSTNFASDLPKPRGSTSSVPKPSAEIWSAQGFVSRPPAKAQEAETTVSEPPAENRSASARLLIWRDTIAVILEHPLLGHGPDNFKGPFSRYEGEDLRTLVNYQNVDEAHNEFLQTAATTGLLGLAAYIWVLVAYFRKAYEAGGWVLTALSGGVLAYIIQLQTAFSTIATGIAFWGILGVSVAAIRLRQREET
jgi:O-antigen ligase